jgi:predicted nucleic acid-binding protein
VSRRRVLDSSRLMAHWSKRLGGRKGGLSNCTREDVIVWARDLAELAGTSAILTPVAIEFICGAKSSHELELYRAFLERFDVIDRGSVTEADWKMAARFAAWVPGDSKPRQLGDCLIAAIARRLGYELLTSDVDLNRRVRTGRSF